MCASKSALSIKSALKLKYYIRDNFVSSDGATASGLFLGIGFVLEKMKLEQKVDAVLATRVLRHARPKFISSQVTRRKYQILINSHLFSCFLTGPI